MLDRPDIYRLIAWVEDSHWWYKTLHIRCVAALNRNFNNSKINILDVGCGTGGLMNYLVGRGYKNIEGFDLSEVAVEYSLSRGLMCWKQDIKTLNVHPNLKLYDAIFSCDTLYYLSKEEVYIFLENCHKLLNENGLLVLNIPALEIFSGIHDVAVGIQHRFTRKDVFDFIDGEKYEVKQYEYWPFITSPLIFLVRILQRMKLYFVPATMIKSDVKLPPKLLNWFLFIICSFELKYLAKIAPFGSSIFLVLKKRECNFL